MHDSFEKFTDRVITSSANNTEQIITLGDFLNALTGRKLSLADEDYVLTPKGFGQLVSRLDIPAKAMNMISDNPGLQRAFMTHVAQQRNALDTQLSVRIDGQTVTGLVGSDYFLARNNWLVFVLHRLMLAGDLPDDLQVHSSYLADNGRSMRARLVSPSLTFNLGIGRSKDLAYAGLWIANDELGQFAFQTGAQIARVDCFNTVTAQAMINVNHRFASEDDFISAFKRIAGVMADYGDEMSATLRRYRGINLENPTLVLGEALRRLQFPSYAARAAKSFFSESTGGESLFDVVNALTWGSQLMANPPGRNRPRFDDYTRADRLVIDSVATVIEDKGEGAFVQTVGDLRQELENVPAHARLTHNLVVNQSQINDEDVVDVRPE